MALHPQTQQCLASGLIPAPQAGQAFWPSFGLGILPIIFL